MRRFRSRSSGTATAISTSRFAVSPDSEPVAHEDERRPEKWVREGRAGVDLESFAGCARAAGISRRTDSRQTPLTLSGWVGLCGAVQQGELRLAQRVRLVDVLFL